MDTKLNTETKEPTFKKNTHERPDVVQAPTAEMFNMFCEISNPLHIKQMKKAEKTHINMHSKIFSPSPMLEEIRENQSKIDNNRKSKIIMQVIP